MSYQHLSIELREGVAVVTMNRPPVNALSPEFIAELAQAADELSADESVRAVLFLSAIPGRYVAGADLMSFIGMSQQQEGESPEESTRRVISGAVRSFQSAFDRIAAIPKPTVAGIQGHALGGGCEFALACDFRLMDDGKDTDIGLTETRLGLIPGAGGTQRLPQVVGRGRATEMILRGLRLRGEEARAIGLVNEVYPEASFREQAFQYAKKLADGPTLAYGLAKRAMQAGFDGTYADGLAAEADGFVMAAQSEDAREGLMAFFEGRKPNFRGR